MKVRYVEDLYRLMTKFKEPFDKTVFAFLIPENEITAFLCSTIRKVHVISDIIKIQSKKHDYIL